MALARGAAASALRQVDLTDPGSWEFSGFSQNGEDGILDVLTRRIIAPNRYFVEIGTSDGLENNTTWLSLVRRFGGIQVEGDQTASEWCKYTFAPLNYGAESVCMFVTRESAAELTGLALYRNPDVFSLDIDGNDYHVMKAVLDSGMRPKIVVVEYNSAYGPEMKVSIPYREDFRITRAHKDDLYYGCSLGGWKALFSKHGYRFVTVDMNGVNAFFVDPEEFDADFIGAVKGREFAENFSQAREYRSSWQQQYELIRDREFVEVTA